MIKTPLTPAQNALVVEHMYLVRRIARSFKCSAETRDQLESEGYIALMRASQLHNDDKPPFVPYAGKWIRGACLQFLTKFKPEGRENQAHGTDDAMSMAERVTSHETPEMRIMFDEAAGVQSSFMERVITLADLTSEEAALMRDGVALKDTSEGDKYLRTRAVELIRRALVKYADQFDEDEQRFGAAFLEFHKRDKRFGKVILYEDILEAAEHYKNKGLYQIISPYIV